MFSSRTVLVEDSRNINSNSRDLARVRLTSKPNSKLSNPFKQNLLPTKLNASIPKASSLTRIPATTSHSPSRFSGVVAPDILAALDDDDDNSSRLSYSEEGLDEWIDEWIDGKTLTAADETEDTRKKDDLEQKTALVNSLAEPFANHIAVLKHEVFETITPVLKHTHLILSHIRNDIEPDKLITGGIDAYEAASEEWDNVMQDQLVEYTTAVEESQNRIKTLVAELQALEERREQWWVRCKALIEQAASSAETTAVENKNATEKVIAISNRRIQSMVSNKGVSKKSKPKAEMNELKALLMGL